MLDTDLHVKKESKQGSVGPDVDRFYHGYAVDPGRPIVCETTIVAGPGERVYAVYTDWALDGQLMMKASDNRGRAWSEPCAMADRSGKAICGFHASVIRLRSGSLGLVYSTQGLPGAHPGRDGGTLIQYRTSDDEGRAWSAPVLVDTHFACCCSGHALQLSTGRLVAPAFKWVSPIPGNDAEGWVLSSNDPSPTLSYSFVFVSDDEGRSWARSHSELFISVNRAAYDLEEPTVVELKDGRLLMHLRSETGRMYRCYSGDGGMSWSRPEGLPIAASYTPHLIRRIPSSGDLLMIWNQSSRQEITTGLHRHRLSCAISRDEGQTWENFKNLESLDDVNVVPPPPAHWTAAVQPCESYGYYQPSPDHRERYVRAPGVLRICYPDVAFLGDEALIVYDYGYGTLVDTSESGTKGHEGLGGTKLRAIPIEWFTS